MPASTPTDVQLEFFRRMDQEALIQSDFTELINVAQGAFAIAASGGSASAPAIGTTNDHPGVWNLNTGAISAAGRIFILSRVNSFTVGVGGVTKFQSWLRIPTLSTPAQRFTVRSGFFNIALPNTIVQGIGFEYDDSQNGGRWQAITDNGPETSVDTGILVTAPAWFKLEWEINAEGTEVEFLIDDVLVATIETNIPSGAGFGHFLNHHIMKLIGTANRSIYLDAHAVFQETEGRE